MEFTATTTITDEQDIFGLLSTAAAVPAFIPAVRMTGRKVSGFCGLCGTVKIVAPHPVNEMAPPAVAACGCS